MRVRPQKILRNDQRQPIAVQLRYKDWLLIRDVLEPDATSKGETDLEKHRGVLKIAEDPLAYQRRMREEWY